METIKSLQNIDFKIMYQAFNKAFCDYEVQLSETELRTMLNRRGFIPELSFAAFVDNQIVAFTLNGIGTFKGLKTAYDTGTGTLSEFRGQGLATKIFEYSIPFLQQAGIRQYLLEVLQHNNKAVSVYRNLGFEVSREFNYFVEENPQLKFGEKKPTCEFRTIDLSLYAAMRACWEFEPSWQNSFEAIDRKPSDFQMLGAFIGNELVGYCIFEPQSGDITQLAVGSKFRRKGIASTLLQLIMNDEQHHLVKAVNTEVDCESITAFLTAKGITLSGKQYEMIKHL